MKHDILEAERKPSNINSIKLREKGIIPCVLFGEKEESIPIAIRESLLAKGLKTGHKIFQIQYDGAQFLVNIDTVQRHPVTRRPIHVAFHRIKMNEKTKVSVPIHFIGHPAGEKEGGILVHQMDKIEVIALPMNIPEFVSVDISDLALSAGKHVRDIQALPGVEFHEDDLNKVICTCTPPKAEKVAQPVVVEGEEGAAAAATATPVEGEAKSE